MSDTRENQDPALAEAESRRQTLETEKAALQNRPHSGFADAARVLRLESEIEALDEQIEREKQRAQSGEG